MKYITIILLLVGFSQGFAQTENSGREVYRATPEMKTKLKHTKLKVSFNFEDQTLDGEEWLTASPFFYESDSLILDAKAMIIHEVKMENKPLSYLYKDDFLRIKLDKIYRKGENYTIYIKYTAQPEKVTAKGSQAINDAKGLYFINPKGELPNVPTQVWTQGETESSSCWFPTLDKPNQKTTQEIYITVPDKFVTLSNGILQSSEKQNDNLRTDYWVMDKPHAPYLFFMGVGDFAVVKDTPWRGKVPVDYYVEKEYEKVAKQIFGHTAEMIEFFSKRFGYDFPWQKYAQMVVRDFVAGAMENTTAVSHGESAHQTADVLADNNYWEAVIAHEMGHHWFGNLVTTESWSNLTINESFANYSEYLWYEYKYGKDVADYHLTKSVNQYHHRPNDFVKDLVRFGYNDKEDMFDLVSYNKGGGILNMLRDYLGDEAFFQGITDFLKTYEFGTGEAHQLRLSFEKISGKDLNWFFNQWFFGNGNPVVSVENNYDAAAKQIRLKIIQNQEEAGFFEFPLEVDIYQNGKYERHQVWVKARKENEFFFSAEKSPNLVNINPRGVILMREDSYKNAQEYLFQYTHAKDYKSRSQAVEFAQYEQHNELLLKAIKDPFYQIRMEALNALAGQKLSSKVLSEIEKIAKNDPKNLVKSAAMWTLAATKSKKYLPVFEKALSVHSASVKNAALNGIATIDAKRAKRFLEQSAPEDLTTDQLVSLASVVVDNKMERFLEKVLPNFVYYPFLMEDNPEKAKIFERGYLWAMQLDNTKLVKAVAESLKQIAPYSEKGSEGNKAIIHILDKALSVKNTLKSSVSVQQQIKLLQEVKALF
ncbi:M1 family aminopeptidase [Capnocytophaga felis]|uniref:Aminopeptidase N n=1 Tax=Capnocytophaga felis TaxID=2267611 RepID=A0A5M4B9W8_9FLAO|nr:M1 family aminopeptidase [Capnocytophaga felis]GET46388.1 aminopeptidase [Capnocytophaga felis]GET48277.1 aminopeptidase [Capnocytophaga felis]